MSNLQWGQRLVQTFNHVDGLPSLGQLHYRRKIYKRSVTMLAVLLCSATFVALGARQTEIQTLSPEVTPTDSSEQAPTQVVNTSPPSTPTAPSTTSSTDTTSISSNSSTVVVNGKTIPVPANGTYSQTISNGSGSTSININHSSSSQSGQNNSSLNLDINSQSDGG